MDQPNKSTAREELGRAQSAHAIPVASLLEGLSIKHTKNEQVKEAASAPEVLNEFLLHPGRPARPAADSAFPQMPVAGEGLDRVASHVRVRLAALGIAHDRIEEVVEQTASMANEITTPKSTFQEQRYV